MNSRKTLIVILSICLLIGVVFALIIAIGNNDGGAEQEKIDIRALILPKFEVGEMSGDSPGEAQYYYEHYFDGADTYEVSGTSSDSRLYVKDGLALFTLGMGKVNAALGTMAILSDSRFDFSNAYIISTGCAGSSEGYGVMGDVFVITAAVDYDLGYHVDSSELQSERETTWFHDPNYDEMAVVMLNTELTDRVYELVKDVPVETTERTRDYMRRAFHGEAWADRDPEVRKGTTVTADAYWKGNYGHRNALLMTKTYGCPDPYAVCDMEDVAVGIAVKRMGLLDRFIIIRDSVNMDVFMLGATPESLWGEETKEMTVASEDSLESVDIFETAMKNNFAVGEVVIEAILDGTL